MVSRSSPLILVTCFADSGVMLLSNAPVSIRKFMGGESFTRVGISSMWPKRKTRVYSFISGAT